MKNLRLFICLLAGTLLSSCGHEDVAKATVLDFFSAVRSENEERATELYPEFANLKSYYKSDTVIIKSIEKLSDDQYQITLTNKYTNGFGKTTDTQMTLFAKPANADKPSDGYIIYDSKGLGSWKDDVTYKFAKRKGYLQGTGLTDQEIAQSLPEAYSALIEHARKFLSYLEENVTVESWNWERLSTYASGSGVVKNNTGYTIPNIKYIVTFYTADGTEVTQDTGTVTYSDMRPHGMESFSFMTSHVQNASRAKIALEFDAEFIIRTAAEHDFE